MDTSKNDGLKFNLNLFLITGCYKNIKSALSNKVKSLKKSLMQDLLTGKIRAMI
jgi:hypothetical protein